MIKYSHDDNAKTEFLFKSLFADDSDRACPSTVKIMNFHDHVLLNQSNTIEEFLSKPIDQPLDLRELFSLLRTWNKSIHQHFSRLILLTLENEIDINEHDVVTGMNLLHFTCKFGAKQIGRENEALRVIEILIRKGIDLLSHCLWVQMNCLHYCGFFDAPVVCEFLLQQPKIHTLINQGCPSADNQSPLHLACAGLSLATARVLLVFGADKSLLDEKKRTPADCVPKSVTNEKKRSAAETLRKLLYEEQLPAELPDISPMVDQSLDLIQQNPTQFQIGERVRLSNHKTGTVKYYGSVPFGVNLWYGIELDEPSGKHDGCVGGIRYFSCGTNRGIFVQGSSLRKLSPIPQSPERERRFRPINFPILDISTISSRVDSGLRRDSSADDHSTERFHIDDRVSLSKNRHGTVKYVGSTPLGSGIWYGVELDSPDGLHDGCLSVDGKRYFHCKPQHGVFVRIQNMKRLKNKQNRHSQQLSHSFDGSQKRHSRMTASEYKPNSNALISSMIDGPQLEKSIDSNIQSTTFNMGDKVLCHNHLAIVRFIGTTLFAEGIWIGIEFLSRSLGKNDGSVNGHVYFQCKSNHGLFVRPNRLTLTKK